MWSNVSRIGQKPCPKFVKKVAKKGDVLVEILHFVTIIAEKP